VASAAARIDAVDVTRAGREFLAYFACSALGLGTDLAIYSGLLALGLGWSWAAAAGFCGGLVVVYLGSVRFVFAHRALRNARAEFVLFAAIGLWGLLLTEALLWLLLEHLALGPVPAKLLTAGAVFCSNFGLRKLMLFTPRKGAR
jgi:putative flippase GtrA